MASKLTIAPHVSLPKPIMDQEWATSRSAINLNDGNVTDAFRVFDGPCVILSMFLEITTAVSAGTVNMSWILESDAGGSRVIGNVIDIAPSALGDFYWAELDGSTLIQSTTGTGLPYGAYIRAVSSGYGVIVPKGGIDIVLSASVAAGEGTMTIVYKPLQSGASIVPEDSPRV
ncbi:MAG: hypothetical protein GY941_21705 [Planctomycetes bacterium]|nr:hypothetical protein [Planctomycetota bacterium]